MTYPKTCPHCGQSFNARRPGAIYCTPACRTGAFRIRSGSAPVPTYRDANDLARRAELRAARLRSVAEKLKPSAL